jgi:maltose O-acetyltransferase
MSAAERSASERMLAGDPYDPMDAELVAARTRARVLTGTYNASAEGPRRTELLHELLGACGDAVWIEPPFYCDYGSYIFLGQSVFANFGCVVLDCAHVEIGDNTFLGPYVQIYAATHPVEPEARRAGLEFALPVRIAADVWIGGSAIICPGVTIGAGTTVGAGSVVTADLPARVIAAGNPCRIIRRLD